MWELLGASWLLFTSLSLSLGWPSPASPQVAQSSALQAPLRTECIQGWGNILLAHFPQQTSVPHSPVAVWL